MLKFYMENLRRYLLMYIQDRLGYVVLDRASKITLSMLVWGVFGILGSYDYAIADQTDFLLLGTGHKAVSGAGLTQLSGYEAVATNPAAIGLARAVPISTELSLVSLTYSYQYPEEDRAMINLNTPMVFLGGTYHINKRLRLGWSLMPIPGGASKIEVAGVSARTLGESPAKMDVTSETAGVLDYKLASGVSWRASRNLSLGLALLANKSEVRTTVTDTESGSEIIDLTSKTNAHAVLLGTTLIIPAWGTKLAVTYRSAVAAKLEGKSNREGGSDFNATSKHAHRFAAGAEQALWQTAIFAELAFSPRSTDEGVSDAMQLAGDGTIARRDVLSYATGIKVPIFGYKVCLSYGWVPSAIGDGIMASRDEDKTEFFGVGFGDLTAISRHHFGVGSDYTIGALRMRSSFSVIEGSRSVPEWSRGYGDYRLSIYTLSTSADWRF